MRSKKNEVDIYLAGERAAAVLPVGSTMATEKE